MKLTKRLIENPKIWEDVNNYVTANYICRNINSLCTIKTNVEEVTEFLDANYRISMLSEPDGEKVYCRFGFFKDLWKTWAHFSYLKSGGQ